MREKRKNEENGQEFNKRRNIQSNMSLQGENTIFQEVMSSKIPLDFVYFDVYLTWSEYQGKPDILDSSYWCEHQQSLNKYFILKEPILRGDVNSPENVYNNEVYKLLKNYILITDCQNDNCFASGVSIFIDKGFTNTANKNGNDYTSTVEQPLDHQKLTTWALAVRFLGQNKLTIVHPRGGVYKFIPDEKYSDPFDVASCKNLFLRGSMCGDKLRSFLCLGCGDLSTEHISVTDTFFVEHCEKFHNVRDRYSKALFDFVFDYSSVIAFAGKLPSNFNNRNKDSSKMIQELRLPHNKHIEHKIKSVLFDLNRLSKTKTKKSCIDINFKHLIFDQEDRNIYGFIKNPMNKIHTFVSLSEDGFSNRNDRYESIIAHFTKNFEFEEGTNKGPKSDHYAHPLSISPISSTSPTALEEHILSVVDDTLGSWEQLSAFCTKGTSNMTNLRVKCCIDLCQLFFKDNFDLILKSPDFDSSTDDGDIFLSILSKFDLEPKEFEQLAKISVDERRNYNTVKKVDDFIKRIQNNIDYSFFYETQDDLFNSDNDNENFRDDSPQVYQNEDYDIDREYFIDENNNTPTAKEGDTLSKAQPNTALDKFLSKWDKTDYEVGSSYYSRAIEILKDEQYTLTKCRNMFKTMRKIASDIDFCVTDCLGFKKRPCIYNTNRLNFLKEFLEPYLADSFRPENFQLFSQANPEYAIATKYWLSYNDLLIMRVLYSHTKELFFLNKIGSEKDLSPFLYRKISETGYNIGTSMLNAYLNLGFIKTHQYKEIDNKNKNRFTEFSSGALTEILDILSVNSLSKSNDIKYISILLCQFIIFKFSNDLKIDYDGHFTEKYFRTDYIMSEPENIALSTASWRRSEIIDSGPFLNDPAFDDRGLIPMDIESATVGTKIRQHPNSSPDLTKSPYERSDFEIYGNGRTRLLRECIKAIQNYQIIVKNELEYLTKVTDNIDNSLYDLEDKVEARIYASLKKKSILNLIIHSKFINKRNPGIMSYVLNFMQSVVIQTSSNEKSLSLLKSIKDNNGIDMKNDLFEPCLHLNMWNAADCGTDFFETLNKGPEIKLKRDTMYNISSKPIDIDANSNVERENAVPFNIYNHGKNNFRDYGPVLRSYYY
ncbi:hypothetical protein HANVADRAFT_6556 [Hanseniaspora valbyensis NRRL Y-1626]|uniref:Uncharacterized protein n=1 Tax=Hanseniaspora valbyensis NRRL Y-1626 TaxID=766949 RepID=A0A1B7TE67_9ASCO|nr:hypothetical protein HANVADRAFT_6556 [Hanseniaspora valbyensis NRRL Y-1626]